MYYAKLAITSSLFIALLGCQPDERINELKSEIQDQEAELTELNDSISTVNDSIRLVTSIMQEQRELSQSITDSVHDYIMESPIATAYIKTYDREPIEIVNDFFTTDNEEAQQILVLYHLVLQIYGNDPKNMRTVAIVRQGLSDFDRRKNQADDFAENASYWKSRYEASAEEKRRRFEELTNRLNTKKDELKELENDGIF